MASIILSKPSPKSLLFLSRVLTRSISTFPPLSQEPQLQDPSPSSSQFPQNPSSGSPFYQGNWRNPNPNPNPTAAPSSSSLSVVGPTDPRILVYAQTLDASALMDVFAELMTSQKWSDLKQLFEFWIRSLDASGKPNKPDVGIFNHYLRAHLMTGASPGELLDLVAQMEEYEIAPNTASYNLVLKAMFQAKETDAAEKLIDR